MAKRDLPPCDPGCGVYRIEQERPSVVPTSWTKAELFAEVGMLRADLKKARDKADAYERQVRKLEAVPLWIRNWFIKRVRAKKIARLKARLK